MAKLYGIKNCDTVKKARKCLDELGLAYEFHDYKTDGLSREQLLQFADQLGWQTVINRSSTSWRQLPSDHQSSITALFSDANPSESAAVDIILSTPTLLKRPILHSHGQFIIGFKADSYKHLA
jgi:arsenate reductase (glutaredoxin)